MTGFEAQVRENTGSETHADREEVGGGEQRQGQRTDRDTETHGHRGFSSKLTPKRPQKLWHPKSVPLSKG